MRLLLLLAGLGLATTAGAQPLLVENFSYAAGSLPAVSDSLWKVHSGNASPVLVADSNLVFAGYSGAAGRAAFVLGGAGSREDVNRRFAPVTAGPVYASMLVRVRAATATPDYFFHLAEQAVQTGTNGGINSATFRARLFAVRDGAGFRLGISKTTTATAAIAFDPAVRTFGTTYLVVVKHDVVAGATNDAISLNVFAEGESFTTEPATPDAATTDGGGPDPVGDVVPGAVVLRQGAQAIPAVVDGLRVGPSFAGVTAVSAGREDVAGRDASLEVRGAREVRFRVREAQAVTVALYDALGRRVASLFDGAAGAGAEHAVETPGGLPAGAYFVRLEGETVRATRSLVVR